jgi:ABC-type oligopeptide transport system substrate-binding subunit
MEMLHDMAVRIAISIAQDPRISNQARYKGFFAASTIAAKLMPDSRRYEAEQVIKADQREREETARSKRRAKLVPVKYPGAA